MYILPVLIKQSVLNLNCILLNLSIFVYNFCLKYSRFVCVKDLTLWNFGSWHDRNALKTPTRSGERARSLLLQKVDEDGQAHSRSFLAGPRAGSRSISSPRARSRSMSSLEHRMLVEERLQFEEERRRFLLRKRKQEESKRWINEICKEIRGARNYEYWLCVGVCVCGQKDN